MAAVKPFRTRRRVRRNDPYGPQASPARSCRRVVPNCIQQCGLCSLVQWLSHLRLKAPTNLTHLLARSPGSCSERSVSSCAQDEENRRPAIIKGITLLTALSSRAPRFTATAGRRLRCERRQTHGNEDRRRRWFWAEDFGNFKEVRRVDWPAGKRIVEKFMCFFCVHNSCTSVRTIRIDNKADRLGSSGRLQRVDSLWFPFEYLRVRRRSGVLNFPMTLASSR